ncbi:hypothetical protein DY000_02029749 [Brassica cretica]|uniref:Uncharacterized protein n=1 Tax=Brassica cretica TaxID=69181 RepID=A0ABQ7DWK7_BRACR|nr:hypothetical protein DY000_02029749 [Brassica cretica]
MVKKEFIQHRERLILKSNPVAKRSVQPGMVATDRITRVEMGAGQLEYYRKHPSLSILEIVGDPIFDVYDAADHVFDGFEVIAKEDQVFVLGNQEEEDVSFGAAKYVQHEENVVPQVSLWRSCDMP